MTQDKLFISNKEKITISFSRDDFKNHTGISGLKYFLIISYIRKHIDVSGEVNFSLNKLISECGYPNLTNKKYIYEDFRTIIQNQILDKRFALCNCDILTVKPSTMITLNILNTSFLLCKNNFVILNIKEFDTIVNLDVNINKSILIGTYLYIKQFISTELNTPKISYPSLDQIKNNLGLSLSSVQRAIDILVENKLLYKRNHLYIKHDTHGYVQIRNIYALDKSELYKKGVLLELSKIYDYKTIYDISQIQN